MKIGQLKSIGHNVADSSASGIGLMIGVFEMDIFADASANKSGFVCIDFVHGKIIDGKISTATQRAISHYKEALPGLCARHGVNFEEIKVLNVRYGTDPVYGRHFTVTVESMDGKRSTDQYIGMPGRKYKKQVKRALQVATSHILHLDSKDDVVNERQE